MDDDLLNGLPNDLPGFLARFGNDARRLGQASPGLSRRVRLPLQPPHRFQELSPNGPTAGELRSTIVETGEEAFLVHEFSSAPDFDRVLKVTLTPEPPPPFKPSYDRGMLWLLDAESLTVGGSLTCSSHDGTRRQPFDVAATMEREVDCEAGELTDVAGRPNFRGKRPATDLAILKRNSY
jgi:hypothetical protein